VSGSQRARSPVRNQPLKSAPANPPLAGFVPASPAACADPLPALPRWDDGFSYFFADALWTVRRRPAPLRPPRGAVLLIARQPFVKGLPRHPVVLAQRHHAFALLLLLYQSNPRVHGSDLLSTASFCKLPFFFSQTTTSPNLRNCHLCRRAKMLPMSPDWTIPFAPPVRAGSSLRADHELERATG